MATSDVAVVGAGPYGLSTAAHLKAANALDIHIFGKPMSFWEQHMPTGMRLRSPLAGSHLSDPQRSLTLHDYAQATGNGLSAPLPLSRFIHYGQWFQSQAVPCLHSQKIERIEKNCEAFHFTTDGGEKWKARRVVVAAGIESFAWRPREFRSLPAELASHTCDHRNLSRFAGKRIAVIGAGQSALESAALLHEAGAEVELLVRAAFVRWLWRQKWFHTFRPIAMLLYSPPDVGQAGLSHIVARPNLFRRLPRRMQDRWGVRAIRPAAAAWLHQRCASIPIRTGLQVTQATEVSGQVRLKLSDGTERVTDHVLLATGYRVDIRRYSFLSSKVLGSIQCVNGYPCLDSTFQSSLAGLYFVGAPAAWSFGPLMRFVAGADLASRAVTRGILRKD
jgi:cation diffusion facilitator CzcD-associated flavoprotein CzcO